MTAAKPKFAYIVVRSNTPGFEAGDLLYLDEFCGDRHMEIALDQSESPPVLKTYALEYMGPFRDVDGDLVADPLDVGWIRSRIAGKRKSLVYQKEWEERGLLARTINISTSDLRELLQAMKEVSGDLDSILSERDGGDLDHYLYKACDSIRDDVQRCDVWSKLFSILNPHREVTS